MEEECIECGAIDSWLGSCSECGGPVCDDCCDNLYPPSKEYHSGDGCCTECNDKR